LDGIRILLFIEDSTIFPYILASGFADMPFQRCPPLATGLRRGVESPAVILDLIAN
jgi:hypothetical protein